METIQELATFPYAFVSYYIESRKYDENIEVVHFMILSLENSLL